MHTQPTAEELGILYHVNSKMAGTTDVPFRIPYGAWEELRKFGERTFPNLPTIQLPDPISPDAQLGVALACRRSHHTFTGSLSLVELSTLLKFGAGEHAHADGRHRSAPSAGALQPLDCWIFVFDVEGLEAGIYFYSARNHTIVRIGGAAPERATLLRSSNQPPIKTAPVIIAVSAHFERSSLKYKQRAYRFCLIEAGHIAQNLWLVAESLGLGAVTVGGFVNDIVNDLIGLDGVQEAALYLFACGRNA